MNLSFFSKTWDGVHSENRFHRLLLPVLCVALALTTYGWLRKDVVAIVMPPKVIEQLEISQNKANGAYKKAWGVFVAELLGNITPGNADFVIDALQSMMDSNVYHQLRQSVGADLELIKHDQVALSFHPTNATYEPETDKVFVPGTATIEGTGARSDKFDRTFEFCILQSNGKPLVTQLRSYQGEPHVRSYWTVRNKANDEEAKSCAAN